MTVSPTATQTGAGWLEFLMTVISGPHVLPPLGTKEQEGARENDCPGAAGAREVGSADSALCMPWDGARRPAVRRAHADELGRAHSMESLEQMSQPVLEFASSAGEPAG